MTSNENEMPTTYKPNTSKTRGEMCRWCRWWDLPVFGGDTAAGRVQATQSFGCRRRSPAVPIGDGGRRWPLVHGNEWCGDFTDWGGGRP